ncbi:polysaccharide biosynthesis protein [Alphaproteobacteria bacterium]|nr:polysaccharide biosynthesis protein [Alphaproteobacteria bacterium]
MEFENLFNRKTSLFFDDFSQNISVIDEALKNSKILIIGGAGSIGQSVVKNIILRNPKKIDVIDISENNLVELVRSLRSDNKYTMCEFKTFAIDAGSLEFELFIKENNNYDYILNLSAMKHVRSERDKFTLMRMIEVNIFNTNKVFEYVLANNLKKYFAVSTDKAANPGNIMGCTKYIMELFLMERSKEFLTSTARFANVAFSDGSLLQGIQKRLEKGQPISAPKDIKRYFIMPEEAGELCVMSCVLGNNRDIFFPKVSDELKLTSFPEIIKKYLHKFGYDAFECSSEDEAKKRVNELKLKKKWPCYFFNSNTTGEKSFEEFFTKNETIDFQKFKNLGVIRNNFIDNSEALSNFTNRLQGLRQQGFWTKQDLTKLIFSLVPQAEYNDTGLNLDQRM